MLHKIYLDDGATGGAGGTQQAPAQQGAGSDGQSANQGKTFSQDEVNALMAKMEAKLEAKAAQKQRAIEEAERLKNMSEQERATEELKQAKAKIAEYEQKQLVSEFRTQLAAKGLPADLADVIPVGDADKAKAAVDAIAKFKATYDAKVAELEEKLKNAGLRGTPPPAGTNPPSDKKLGGMGGWIADGLNKTQ